MKFTLSWLKEHLDTFTTLAQITETLTMIGLEVEQVIDRAAELKPFTVAKILSAEKHPEADKLSVCKVQSDIGELQIVCGAPNARAGIYVALAKEGTLIPRDQFKIKKTKIRGVESSGMLCSADELGLGSDSAGIIELPEAKIGESIVSVLGLDDPVIDVAITPNRADALGVRGIARDLAAAGLGTLKPLPDLSKIKGSGASPIKVSITTPNCQQFLGIYIKGVKNGASPDWMQKRLIAIGQKPISALVDITNYITIDLGRPLHVYDAKKLKGNITVRDGIQTERLTLLNGGTIGLSPGMIVIADDSGAISLGGVMGGNATGCTETTTDIFLEVALFDPAQVARSGRIFSLESDARYRFERGVDPAFIEPGAKIAQSIIQQLCGGSASEPVIAGKAPEWKRTIAFKPELIATLGGVNIAKDKVESILKSLGFTPAVGGWQPPSWRGDIEGEADLVEEVLRIAGYDQIPTTPLPKFPTISKPALNIHQKRAHLARRLLASRGMLEACTWSFLPERQAHLFGGNNPKLKLVNPIAADLDTMRPSLLPNLLEAARRNAFRGFKNLALFETGLQFSDVTPDGQRMAITGIRTGTHTYYTHGERMETCQPPLDTFDAKTDALAVLQALGLNKADITTDVPPWYHPGRSGALTLGGKIILGYFGEVHPGLLPAFEIETTTVAFEIFPDAIPVPRGKSKSKGALKLSDFQAVERDFAFTVDSNVSAADITKSIASADKQLITDVAIFDVYTGKGVPEGKKSVAVKVTLQSFERTLSEADITTVSQAIVAAAGKGFGGQLRQ